MRHQAKYIVIYICVLCFLVGSVLNLAQAQDTSSYPVHSEQPPESLPQAKLDQMLAPISLYPDTLLSHIFVASTYPLEVIQAARWRNKNQDLDEQEALNATDNKNWDPSVKALVPFHDLLQKLNADLSWLQSLGSAFLFEQARVLDTIQALRQKAYAQGNLYNNEYHKVVHEDEEIVIQSVEKHIVYVPHYDTRVVYGNWWWHDHPPHYWHTPSHYVLSSGFYWGPRIHIRPSFYFAGFHWQNRYTVTNHNYRVSVSRHWSQKHHSPVQRVRVKEYPKWRHNEYHRRGAHYKYNGHRVVRNTEKRAPITSSNSSYKYSKKHYKTDKQRVLNVSRTPNKTIKIHNNKIKHKAAKQDKPKDIKHQQADKRRVLDISRYPANVSSKGMNRKDIAFSKSTNIDRKSHTKPISSNRWGTNKGQKNHAINRHNDATTNRKPNRAKSNNRQSTHRNANTKQYKRSFDHAKQSRSKLVAHSRQGKVKVKERR